MPITSEAVRFEGVTKRFFTRAGRTLKEMLPSIVGLGHRPNSFAAVRDLSFVIGRGETLGIIGRNGSGKSTALKLIARVMTPDEGSVQVAGRVAPLLELGACFHPDLTGRENVFLNASILGMPNRQARLLLDDIVAFAELQSFIDMPVKRYSSGMALRLGFSVAIHSEPDVILVDEALAVGDRAFQEKCLERMRRFQLEGASIVVVSHSLELIREFCDRAILLDSGQKADEGPPAAVIDRYLATT